MKIDKERTLSSSPRVISYFSSTNIKASIKKLLEKGFSLLSKNKNKIIVNGIKQVGMQMNENSCVTRYTSKRAYISNWIFITEK